MAIETINNRIIGGAGGVGTSDMPASAPSNAHKAEFQNLLKDNLKPESATANGNAAAASAPPAPLKFSSHAIARIRDRGIAMGKEQMDKLEKAVDTAAAKGAKESLILSNDAAFIVSVKNRTVITVVDRNNMNGNVFTNIDSTVVL